MQESVAVVDECVCCERGCWFARAAVGFVVSLHVRVGVSRRVLLCLVLVEVRFPQNCVVLLSGCCGVALWVEVSIVCWVAVALPSWLRTVLGLFLLVVVLPQGLGYAAVVLAVAF
ncbi:hypothetical protein Taro_019888, partial [Colocasia esculenta]|nr:hypothetical protein [Colocasia esculenta]